MAHDFDFLKMQGLLADLSLVSGIRYSLADADGRIICSSGDAAPFCAFLNALPEGRTRCERCAADAIATVKRRKTDSFTFRCHAGVVETVVAVRQGGDPVAYVFFGQVLLEGDLEPQWTAAREALVWLPGADSLKTAFIQLRQSRQEIIDSCARVLAACSSYVWMEDVIESGAMSDEQRLNRYLSEHYAEDITLDDVADALSMSKTKLCSVASKQGTTVVSMINTRRMEEAKRLFRQKSDRIADVAAHVGVPDFNYFTKLFKAYTGKTPSAYRKQFKNG